MIVEWFSFFQNVKMPASQPSSLFLDFRMGKLAQFLIDLGAYCVPGTVLNAHPPIHQFIHLSIH